MRLHYPTEEAYLAACRALHWRTAELRFHGIEPIQIPPDAPHEPPADFDFSQGKDDRRCSHQRESGLPAGPCSICGDKG